MNTEFNEHVQVDVKNFENVMIPYVLTDRHALKITNEDRITGKLSLETHYGSLYDELKIRPFTESVAKFYFRQMVEILCYFHKNEITMPCLSVKEFVFSDPLKKVIVLKHLTNALVLKKNFKCVLMQNQTKLAYTSPEVFAFFKLHNGKPPTEEICYYQRDSWTLGVLLFVLCHRRFPFSQIEDVNKLIESVSKCKFNVNSLLSIECRLLIFSLIKINPSDRLNVADVEHTSWFKSCDDFTF